MSTIMNDKSVDRYVAGINRYPLLTRDQENRLALEYRARGNVSAGHQLVVANLRFVVKVAHEYKGYGLKLLDLIQEGNIGLIKAVQKFDPNKGFRLISYAVWWIRAYIQNFIMRSWSLVKLGTTQAQRKLFFKLRSEKQHLDDADAYASMAERFGVDEHDVRDMEYRLTARDFSLDAELQDGARQSYVDQLAADLDNQEVLLAAGEERVFLQKQVKRALEGFNDKERFIVEHRLMADEPMTLQEIGERFGISRERARQIESNVLRKLRHVLLDAGLEAEDRCAA
jgi:RNA polymerase sigma-32 factor